MFAGVGRCASCRPIRRVADCDLVSFAEVVTRDPFLLLGREPRPDFVLRDLLDVRVATVSEVPTPWMCLQDDLRRAGITPSELTRIGDRTMADNVAALRRGEVDVVQVFEPFGATLLAEGAGHLWFAQASRGPTSYTTFYARRRLLAERQDELRAHGARDIPHAEMGCRRGRRCDCDRDRAVLRRRAGGNPRRCLCALQIAWHLGPTIRACLALATTGCAPVWSRAGSCRPARHTKWQWTTASPMRPLPRIHHHCNSKGSDDATRNDGRWGATLLRGDR